MQSYILNIKILHFYERIQLKKIINSILKIAFPLFLGGAILYWTYRDFEITKVGEVLLREMNYGWMLFSLFFGVLSHVFRGWRWKQTLKPLGENPKTSNCVYAIFVSYATNLLIPRIGEISRCGVLSRYDGVSFSKSLGTVVTERLIDTFCIGLITGVTLLLQMGVFSTFFHETGTDLHSFTEIFTSIHLYIVLVCVAAILVLLYLLVKRLAVFGRVKGLMKNVWAGILSLRRVKNIPLFLFYTLAIWICYFLHFYLTFYCFDFTSHLGWMAGLVMFVVGSIAVVVPTPNGAGPWHFAVISMMMLYGVGKEDAGIFALIVHGIQTLLIILLGIYGLAALPFTNKKKSV